LLIPIVTNNTFLVPIVRPALPKLPFGAPPNHAGTVTYDVRREVREILRAGSRGQPALVMGHLTYPHLPAYPGSVELSWQEFVRVARAPAGTVFDRSFDWQDADKVDDPLQLHRWKIAHLLEVIRSEVDSSGHLERGGRLVLFSDHGDRANLKLRNFGDPRYHHVLLATFGVPARCTSAPISLADIGMLLQFADVHTDPAVEYMFTPETLVPILVRHAELRWSGDVDIDPALLSRLFKELQRHDPWTELTGRACGETTQRQ
jgi:hypothetical protein